MRLHLIHDWGKWQTQEVELAANRFVEAGAVWIQTKNCLKCDKMKARQVNF